MPPFLFPLIPRSMRVAMPRRTVIRLGLVGDAAGIDHEMTAIGIIKRSVFRPFLQCGGDGLMRALPNLFPPILTVGRRFFV